MYTWRHLSECFYVCVSAASTRSAPDSTSHISLSRPTPSFLSVSLPLRIPHNLPGTRYQVVKLSQGGTMLPTERDIEDTYLRQYDAKYGPTYAVLDILQQVPSSTRAPRVV